MKIKWNQVTWYSKLVAVIFFVGIYLLGFYFGIQFTQVHEVNQVNPVQCPVSPKIINDVAFLCSSNKVIQAQFRERSVNLELSDGRNLTLPQTMSADGARYANADESFIFWNKGDGAVITEHNKMTFNNCQVKTQTGIK